MGDGPRRFRQLNFALREPILLLRFSGKNGESSGGPFKNLIPELLPAIAEPNAEGNYFEGYNVMENSFCKYNDLLDSSRFFCVSRLVCRVVRLKMSLKIHRVVVGSRGNHQMARIVRHNEESVREGYTRNGGKEVKLFTGALKAFRCNNRIVMAQRTQLDDFLRRRIIGRLECGRTQLEVSEELGIAQSVNSRLWQRFQDDANGTCLYARRPVRCVPLTATHCRLRLTWSREHALWTPQQWFCMMFSDVSRFSLQSDSLRTLIWRAPGTRYHQEKTIERLRYDGEGWLVWGGIILGSRTDLLVQSVTMTGDIYRDVILEQHVRLFRGAMGAEFLFMDDNARPHHANIVDDAFNRRISPVWIS
ncbi:transposable element Tcb1 transposase [Trichonephila clavipes]|nr:transposable element Tcb1 transposase [Trichonephila clavipes]